MKHDAKKFNDSVEIQQFIEEHYHDDIHRLLLKKDQYPGIPINWVVTQIQGRKKTSKKLPSWSRNKKIMYPPTLNLEQSSSEITANYKSSLVKAGKIGIDLSGGFGVDTFFLSKAFEQFYYVEPDEDLCAIAKHNFRHLDAHHNICIICSRAEEFIEDHKLKADFIYVDPSRRDNLGRKKILIEDYQPDIVQLLPRLQEMSDQILIKTSPLLDLSYALNCFCKTKSIHIVAVKNECKEVLYLLDQNYQGEVCINTINFENNKDQQFNFYLHEEKQSQVNYAAPSKYIYDPNAAVLKSGAFNLIAKKFNLNKLHPNTHLYTSEQQVEAFPGHVYQLEARHYFSKKESKVLFGKKFNVFTKNFPLNTHQLQKKLKLQDGGEQFLLATQILDGKHVLLELKRV